MKYDNLRLCNDYIKDMEVLLDEIAVLVGVHRGERGALVRAVRRLEDAALKTEVLKSGSGPELWRVRYLCNAILNNCVTDATKFDAAQVLAELPEAPKPRSGQ